MAFDELLRRLIEADVDFVLVGGLAVNAWGVVRGTKDVDIVPRPDAENLLRLARVAEEAGGHVQLEEALLSSSRSIAGLLASGERVLIETHAGALDVVQGLPGVPSYEELQAGAVDVQVAGVRIRVCGLDDLISMKRVAGRTRDMADLEDLQAARGDHPDRS